MNSFVLHNILEKYFFLHFFQNNSFKRFMLNLIALRYCQSLTHFVSQSQVKPFYFGLKVKNIPLFLGFLYCFSYNSFTIIQKLKDYRFCRLFFYFSVYLFLCLIFISFDCLYFSLFPNLR